MSKYGTIDGFGRLWTSQLIAHNWRLARVTKHHNSIPTFSQQDGTADSYVELGAGSSPHGKESSGPRSNKLFAADGANSDGGDAFKRDMERRMDQALIVSQRRRVEMMGLSDADHEARLSTVDATADLFPTTEKSIYQLCNWAFDENIDHNRRRLAMTALRVFIERGNVAAREALDLKSIEFLSDDLPYDIFEEDDMPRILRSMIDILTGETFVSPKMFAVQTVIPWYCETMQIMAPDTALDIILPIMQEGRRKIRAMASCSKLEENDSVEDNPCLNFITMYRTLLVGLSLNRSYVNEEIGGLLDIIDQGSGVGPSFATSALCAVVETVQLDTDEVDSIVRRMESIMTTDEGIDKGAAIYTAMKDLIDYVSDDVAQMVRRWQSLLMSQVGDPTGNDRN